MKYLEANDDMSEGEHVSGMGRAQKLCMLLVSM